MLADSFRFHKPTNAKPEIVRFFLRMIHNKVSKFIYGILLDFCLLLFLFFFGRIFYAAIDSVFLIIGSGNPYVIFYSIWMILVFLALYYFLPKKGLNNHLFYRFFFLIVFIGYIGLEVTSWLKRVGEIEVIEKKYIGLIGLDEKEEIDSDGEDVSYLEETKSYVFKSNDPQIAQEISIIQGHHTSGYRINNFIFWQTAFISGFDASYIPNYHCCANYSEEIVLYLNAGPLVIIESFIEAIIDAFLILILPFVFRLRGEHMFFDDFASLKRFVKEDGYIRRPKYDDY